MVRAALTSIAIVLPACTGGLPIAGGASDEPDEPSVEAREPVTPTTTETPGCVDPVIEDHHGLDWPLTSTMPTKPVPFGAVTCRAEREVWRDAEGRIRVCTIAKPVELFGVALAGDNYTIFWADGRPYQTTLARPQTLTTGSGTKVDCAAEHLVLDERGNLDGCTLARTTTYDRAKCRGSESIGFAPTGELAGCVVDRPVHGLDVVFRAGTRMGWYPQGTVARAWIEEPLEIDGWRVRYEVQAHPNGELAALELAEPRVVAGIAAPARAKVWLRSDGSPWRLEYVADEGFMIHGEPWTDTRTIRFDCVGQIVSDSTEHYQAESRPPKFRD